MIKNVVFILLLWFLLSGSGDFKEKKFQRVTSGKITSLGIKTYAINKIACASLCLRYLSICFSFSYNLTNGQCELGSWLVPSIVSPPNEQVKVYSTGLFCDITAGLQLVTSGNYSACVWLSSYTRNYTSAKDACVGVYWVGLDDMEVEGTFRWGDDRSILNSTWMKTIFCGGQPDNRYDSDCIIYNSNYPPLDDALCSEKKNFICEYN